MWEKDGAPFGEGRHSLISASVAGAIGSAEERTDGHQTEDSFAVSVPLAEPVNRAVLDRVPARRDSRSFVRHGEGLRLGVSKGFSHRQQFFGPGTAPRSLMP